MGNAVADASPVSLLFIEGDHLSICASAPHSSQAIAWDEPPAAEQLKGKNIEGSLGFSWLLVRLVFLINLVLSFEDVSAAGV